MKHFFVGENNNTNTDILHDSIKKFNTIIPKINNEFFELDIFFSRIISARLIYSSSTIPHKHSFYELIIPISGTATYDFKKNRINLMQNKICLITPNATHRLEKFSDDFAALTFGFYFLAPTTLSLPIRTSKDFFDLKNSPYIMNSIMHMLNLAQGTENGYYQRFNMQFSLLLLDIFSQVEPIHKAIPHIDGDEDRHETISDDTRIRAAIQYISDNISSDVFVDDVAAFAGISSRQLNRILLSAMGISTNELINKIRIKAAKKYIETSSLTLSHISVRCGFNSLTSFNRTFKKTTGVTPSSYKQSVENKTEN